MNVKYKIGDKVRLKKSSQYYPSQSDGTDGKIKSWNYNRYEEKYPNGHDVNEKDDSFYFSIGWENGTTNTYRISDIEPVVTSISIPEVDSYVKVIDPRWEGVMYVQVTRGFSMDDDGNVRGYGNVITFEKDVKNDAHVSIYHEKENRRFQLMNNREIVWMNYCLKNRSYTSYDSWNPSSDDLLKLEVLNRYPSLKKGEKFGFADGQEVKSVHPREWTIDSNCIYLAHTGDGGAKVYEKGEWADRLRYKDPSKVDPEFNSSSWCVACTKDGVGQDELREWRKAPWYKVGYIDNTGYWTNDKPGNKHLISYQTFLDKVYYPYKGETSKYIAGVDPCRDDSDVVVEEPPFKVDDIIEAIDKSPGVLYKVGNIFIVVGCNSTDVVISRDGYDISVPCEFFRKINLVGMEVEVLRDNLQSAGVKKGEILKIESASSKHMCAESSKRGNWAFSIFQLNEKDGLRLIRDHSLSTAIPCLKTSTTKKRESFIEDVDEIRVTKTVSKKSKRLKI